MQKQLLLFVSFVLMARLSFAQANYKDLILGIPECEQKVLRWEQIKTALKTLNGVKIVGFCSRHDVIVLSVNRDIHSTNQAIFDKIKEVNQSYRIFEKVATREEMLQDCYEEMIKQKN
jgi:L-fucose isomerase-like protein